MISEGSIAKTIDLNRQKREKGRENHQEIIQVAPRIWER